MEHKGPLRGRGLSSFLTFIKGREAMNHKFWGVVLTLALVFGLSTAGNAAITADIVQNLQTTVTPVKAQSDGILVLGINVAGDALENLASVKVTVTATANGPGTFDATTDLAALAVDATSGVALYRDDYADPGKEGAFDAGVAPAADALVVPNAMAWAGAGPWTVTIFPAAAEAIPATDADTETGNDYYIVIKTANVGAAKEGNGFTVGIAVGGDIGFSLGTSSAFATAAQDTFDLTIPTITSIDLLDNNSNGKVDRLKVVFTEDMKATDFKTGVIVAGTVGAIPVLSGTESPAGTVTYLLDESHVNSVVNTANTAGDLAYAAGNISDLAGNLLANVVAGPGPAPGIDEVDKMAAVVDYTQGAEIFDTDVNGKIDHIILHLSEDLDETVAASTGLGVAGYTISAMIYDSDATFPAALLGGLGNAADDGLEEILLTIDELGGHDTGALPQVTYSNAVGGLKDLTGLAIASVYPATAAEVDKAVPILLSAYTRDMDADGRIDAYELTFSEHVVSVLEDLASGFTLGAGYSFNPDKTVHTSVDTFVTLQVNETVINTGSIPPLTYAGADINDGATSAAGAPDENDFVGVPAGVVKDGVSPIVKSIRTADDNSNGKIDAVNVEFSEPMKAGIDFKTGVAITGYPLGTPAHVFGSEVVKYVLTEGTAYDTDATPAFSYTPGAIVDANDYPQAAIVSTLAEDNAAPDVVSAVTGDTDVDGKLDQYVLTLSEPIADLDDVAKYDDNFTIAGHVITGANTVKTATSLTFEIDEFAVFDTDAKPELTYAKDATANNIVDLNSIPMATAVAADWKETDGAKPVIVIPVGVAGATQAAQSIDRDGDGYIDGFKVYFSEPIAVNDSSLTGITVAITEDYDDTEANTVTIDTVVAASINAAEQSAIFHGTSDKAGTWDTEATPLLNYDSAAGTIGDTVSVCSAQNMMATKADIVSQDKAIPVLVRAIGQVQSTNLTVQFSEPVYNALPPAPPGVPGGDLEISDFTYKNVYNTGTNATALAGADAEAAADNGADEKLIFTVNNDFLKEDVENDSLAVVNGAVFDGVGNSAGLVYVTINDEVAPKVTAITTIDYDQDGLIDYLRIVFSEDVNDASLSGFVVADSMSADVSAYWDVAGFTGEKWNLYDYLGGTNTDDVAPAVLVNDLFDTAVGAAATDNLDTQWLIDTDGDGFTAGDVIVYKSLLEGAIAFSDNRDNDNILYLALDEASGPANASTAMGNTDATPAVGLADTTLADFKPNKLDVLNSVTTATDMLGPVIMAAKSIAVTKVEVTFSEDINAAELAPADFNLNMPAGAVAVEVRTAEVSPGVATVEVQPNGWWMPDVAGTMLLTLAAVEDVGLNLNSHAGNPKGTAVAVDDNVASQFTVVPATAAPAVGEAFNVTVTALDSDGETDTNFAGEITLGVQSGDASLPNGERYSLTNGVGTFPVVAMNTSAIVIRASYDYGNEVVASGVSAAITAAGLDAPDALTVADYPGDQGGMLLMSFDKSAGQATGYRIYRELVMNVSVDTAGVASGDTVWVPWATVDAIPGAAIIYRIVPTLDNAATRWAVAAELGAETSGQVPSAKLIGDQYLMALMDLRVAEIYGLKGSVTNQMQLQKAAKERFSLERLSPQLAAFGRSSMIQAKMISTISSAMTISAEAVRAVDNIAPTPVTALNGESSEDNSSIVLTWTASTEDRVVGSVEFQGMSVVIAGVEAYQILRKSGADEFAPIASVAAGVTTYTDEDVVTGVFYTYQVVATDLDNLSSDNPMREVSTGLVDVEGNVVVDFDGDQSTGLGDFLELVAVFGQTGDEVAKFDLDRDGTVGLGDFLEFVASYGRVAAGSAKPIQIGLREDASMRLMLASDAVRAGEQVSFDAVLSGVDAISYGFTLRYDTGTFEFLPEGSMVIDQDGKLVVAGTDMVRLVFLVKEFEGEASFEILDAMVLDKDGLGLVRGESAVVSLTPTEFELSQNSPNPFNPETTIRYALPRSADVRFEVCNVLGQVVRTLVDEHQRAGSYTVSWDGFSDDGQALASGIYFYRIGAGSFQATKRMLLLK